NIMITRSGLVKVTDFGLAKVPRDSKASATLINAGTFIYMSPEQVRGRDEVDRRSDIYSLGITIFEMLTGDCPLDATSSDFDIQEAIVRGDIYELVKGNQRVPDPLADLILKAVQKNPEDRYQSVDEMMAAIDAFDGGESAAKKLPVVRPFSSESARVEKNTSQIKITIPPQLQTLVQKSGNTGIVLRRQETVYSDKSIGELLARRQKIDEMIASKHTRDLTVMFCDLVGSTTLFEQRGDVEGRAMVQQYYDTMFPVIREHHGRVIKTIGDGILACFEEPEQACRCAIAMQEGMNRRNHQRMEIDRLTIRIALHYGKAVIDKDDIFGDVVNVAARLEGQAEAGDIMISQPLREQIRGNEHFILKASGKVRFKGKTSEMVLYRLLWRSSEIAAQKKARGKNGGMTLVDTVQIPITKTTQKLPADNGAPLKVLEPFQLNLPEEEETPAEEGVKNPYMNRVKIKNIREFYGRESEIIKIYARLGASRPQSISVVGERRIGKSSLLNFIAHPRSRRQYLKDPEKYLFVFVDFQEHRRLDIPGFFKAIYQSLKNEFRGKLRLSAAPDYEGFKSVVMGLEQQDYKLILVFDEFESVTKNTNFDMEFYSFCRSIANNYNVAYLVASGRNLQTLCHSQEIADSPFFNIFSNLTLGQFSHQEAVNLITDPAAQRGITMNAHFDFVVDIAGYYPLFIQIACAALFDSLQSGESLDYEVIGDEFLDEARGHFQQIWERSDSEKQDILLRLSQGGDIPRAQAYLVRELVKEGYVKRQRREPEVFSSLFAEFIIQQNQRRKKKFLFW
ncbi:MAG: protein kinase, partial [Calditrichaeota bacterium]|nr:protein kinase [Calditrichota bacterium]